MATAGERAAIGAETARMEGRGAAGQGMEAAKAAATGRVGRPRHRRVRLPGQSRSRSVSSSLSSSDEESMRRRHGAEGVRTVVSNEGEAFCPNPNARNLPKEYETRVEVIQRYPEMRTVEKTDYVKEIVNEERTIIVPKTRVVMDEVQHVDRVPIIRDVPKSRIEIVYRVVPEEREVTDMVPVVEYVDTPRIERVPRVIVEDIEEIIRVPVIREVPVTRMVEVPTGNYCEAPAGEFINPSDLNLMGHHHHHGHKTGGLLNRTSSSSSSSSSDNEHGLHTHNTTVDSMDTGLPGHHHHNSLDRTTNGTDLDTTHTAAPKRRSGLLGRIIHH
jgi:hypothetical protein